MNRATPTDKDPYRPVYHLAPPGGWMNDPNGLSQAGGVYHFFYQHFPEEPEPGPMHWGHATSRDLVHWKHEPIALRPDSPFDCGGCWSGSAVVSDDGRLVLVYTGCDEDRNQAQCVAFAGDASNTAFRKFDDNPVVTAPEGVSPRDFRDPKAWRHGDAWYMVVGSKAEARGALQLYTSTDLRSWSRVGVAARAGDDEGEMWECPDLFGLGDRHVFIFSPMLRYTLAVVGDMDYGRGVFTKGRTFVLDYGPDFYAPQTFQDECGRRILVGWMATWASSEKSPTKDRGWVGALTVPRVVRLLEDGTLAQAPVPEVAALRGEHRGFAGLAANEGASGHLGDLSGAVMEIEAEFDLSRTDAARFGLKLRRSPGGEEETIVAYDRERRCVVLDNSLSGVAVPGATGEHAAPLPLEPDAKLLLHVLLDRSSVEVFANDGRVVLTARVYPTREDSLGVDLFAAGGEAALARLDAWRLG
jgi:beta-fructofuranosidase